MIREFLELPYKQGVAGSSPAAPTDTLCAEARRICATYGADQPVRGPSSCNRDPPFARPSARRMYCAELHRWISATNWSGLVAGDHAPGGVPPVCVNTLLTIFQSPSKHARENTSVNETVPQKFSSAMVATATSA